jgi:FkbM family methyltransferase
MKISVIVTIYNIERRLLEACLHSVVKQTLRPEEYEIVLVDDRSTKGDTISVINQFTKGAANMKLVRHTGNRGPNEARHSGVKAASGDYVLFVDGDDMLTRDAVENLRMKAHETAADVVTVPAFRWIWETKSYDVLPWWARPLPSDYVARLKSALSGNHSFTMCGRLFKRAILSDDIFDFDVSPKQLHEDMSTFVRIVFKSQNVAHMHRPIYYYTINETGLTYKFELGHVDGMFYAFNDWIENAKRHGVFEELSSVITQSVERFVNLLVIRCVLCESLESDYKVKILNIINEKYRALSLRQPNLYLPGTELLEHLHADSIAGRPTQLQKAIKQSFPKGVPAQPNIKTRLKYSLVPTEIARLLKDKVVFICRNDYHLRSAAAFTRELRLRGYPCVVLDDSAFLSGGLRQLPPEENKIFRGTERIKIDKPPYGPDWLSTARLVIAFNDFNDDLREALEYRHRLGLPSVCIVEGINDFLRVDFQDYRHLPYRRCDYVFLAGSDDKRYFEDRQTYIVGLPVIESLATKSPTFPEKPLAVLNVNFTYGVLEEAREQFIVKARNAFAACGYEWVITKHPMDKADFSGYPVSGLTQYELIDRCSVFVSRFATGILEALASGKPAIYFNPHNEKVEKFKSPLGAYEIATTEEELVLALHNVAKDIESGVDFRERALPFLEWHTAYQPDGQRVTHRLANAVTEILERDCGQQSAVSDLFFDRLHEQEPFRCEAPGLILGDFERRHKAQLPEEDLTARYFGDRGSIMIDVGAAYGHSLAIYFGKGWTIHAFEPDSNNRQRLLDTYPSCSRLIVNEEAVCDKSGLTVPFFRSDESTGISSLFAFTAGHRQVGEVRTTTLGDYYRKAGLQHVDFLKVDVEGFDKFVLDGFPWKSDKPEVILVEFEDAKTTPLGYSAHELADILIHRGYSVYVSEWLPIVRYGITHDWRRLVRYSSALELGKAWGNMLGFLEDPGEDKLRSLALQAVKFSARPGREVFSAALKFLSVPRQWYLHVRNKLAAYVVRRHPRLARIYRRMRYERPVDYLKRNYPIIIIIGRFVKWSLATLKNTFFGIGVIAALVIAGLYIAGALIEPVRWYLVGIASALLLLCGGLLALSYARFILSNQITQLSDINKNISNINKKISNINKKVSDIRKEVAPYTEVNQLRLERAVRIEKQVEIAELQHDLRDSKPVLFFNATSGPAMFGFASTAGLIISWALRLAGHRVLHLVCRKGLRRCIQGTNRYELNKPMPCETCHAIKNKMFPQDLRLYLEPKLDVPSALIPLESYSLDDLADFVYQGINIGEFCISSVRWTLRRHNLNSDPRATRLLREYIRGGINIVDTLQRLLQEQELHSMVVFNGVFYPEAIARAVALKKGLPVVAYEISIPGLKVFLSHGVAAGGGLITIPEDFQMSANQEAEFDQYMAQRIRGTAGQPGIWPEMKGIEPDLQALVDQYKNVVSVFTNVIFDTSQYGANTVFESMFDWLDEIIKLASLHPETLFVVRAHPAEVFPRHESEELVGDWLKEHSYQAIPNVRFIPPTDYISSYELLNISRFCLVYNSTIGLEAVVLGIPTVTAAAGRYSGAGVTHAPASRKAYIKLVETFLKNGPPPVEDTVRQRARYCMYQLFFRQGLDLSAFLESPDWTLKPIDASALHPDNSPEMNIIYKGIMEGEPFYYPP